MGILAATMANLQRDPKRKKDPWTPEDFMPRFGSRREPVEQTPMDMLSTVELLNAAFGGADQRTTRTASPAGS